MYTDDVMHSLVTIYSLIIVLALAGLYYNIVSDYTCYILIGFAYIVY